MNDFYDFSDLRLGMRINIEGTWADGCMRVAMISIKDDSNADELEANIESVDPSAGTFGILGLTVDADGVEIKDIDKSALSPAALQSGMRIKLKGCLQPERRFLPEKMKLKMHTPDEQDEIEGTITAIDAQTRMLVVMGFEMTCGADVEIEA